MNVHEYVETKVAPQFQNVVTELRQLMRAVAPNTEEAISYGMLVYRGRRILAWINPSKNDITFAFARGAQFEDRYGLLTGVGKSSRHVRIKSLSSINKEALGYYVKQALELDHR